MGSVVCQPVPTAQGTEPMEHPRPASVAATSPVCSLSWVRAGCKERSGKPCGLSTAIAVSPWDPSRSGLPRAPPSPRSLLSASPLAAVLPPSALPSILSVLPPRPALLGAVLCRVPFHGHISHHCSALSEGTARLPSCLIALERNTKLAPRPRGSVVHNYFSLKPFSLVTSWVGTGGTQRN